MSKKVTMQHIADHMGVSKFVVSKALSGKGGVSETTREKVIQTAAQLGYFSPSKPVLAGQAQDSPAWFGDPAKQSVLVLMPNIRFQTRESLYWGRILEGISTRLEEYGLGYMLIAEQSNEHFLQILNPKGIRGLIGVGEISSPILLDVHRAGLPFVLVDHEDSLIPSDTVFVNNYDCIHRLTKHLIAIGHKRLVFVGNIRYSRSFYDRWLGFRSALEEQGLDTGAGSEKANLLHLEGSGSFVGQMTTALTGLRKKGELPSAFVCANDIIAVQLLDALAGLDIRVPDDVSVSGFDNIEKAYEALPPLTTVHVPKEALGRRAVERLEARIRHRQEPAEKLLLGGEVIYRESTAPPREGGSKKDTSL
ncbi:LacI family DNA-binding transcriptional regulator [Paenibacillus puerhi]|uniref:LacI family DNA-binding transcriptional regulator n=1 Tax=Paenibacillus puerhi TaxID=2692622 RepID=UPI00135C0A66|nr:LacI family DNA-binding transcriptional regulator [Paenibacillus puerhi]